MILRGMFIRRNIFGKMMYGVMGIMSMATM
jgi:hypothetical protein